MFSCDSLELFVDYASRCNDEAWVVDVVVDLNQRDEYCVRHSLIKRAADYLYEPGLREFVARLWKPAGDDSDAFRAQGGNHTIEAIARQLKEVEFFERARRASRPGR